MKLVFIAAMSLLSMRIGAQDSIEVNGMEFQYTIELDTLEVVLSAPTLGWVGVGFNSKNDIVGSDLKLFHVQSGEPESLDMHVVGFGNAQEDSELGGMSDIQELKGWEMGKRTFVRFKMPLISGDTYDFKHMVNKPFWLILAYSTHDEFEHHSSMRKHVPFTFTP